MTISSPKLCNLKPLDYWLPFKRRWVIGDLPKNEYDRYCFDIADRHCPFLEPAIQRNVVYATQYKISGNNLDEINEYAFWIAVAHIEFMLELRGQLADDCGSLYCENVIFEIQGKCEPKAGERLLPWPHWILKLLYTPCNILVGDFWKGEISKNNSDESIPVPPVQFFSLRSGVKQKDIRFFKGTPNLLPKFVTANSSDKSPLDAWEIPIRAIKKHDLYELRGKYAALKNWSKNELDKNLSNGITVS